jgi:hypothetical protein
METTRDNFVWKYVDIQDLDALADIKERYLKRKPNADNFYIPMDIGIKEFLGMEIGNPVLIYAMPKKNYMIHIDYRMDKLKLALNIPLINCENSLTEFWKCSKMGSSVKPENAWRSPPNFLSSFNFEQENCEKIDEFIMTQPVVFNTQVPHSVTNFSDMPRIAISLRFKEDPWHLVGL